MARTAQDVEILRTRLTRKFRTLADEVNECFEEMHVGAADFAVELSAPDEPSTGGGKRVLQHVCLRPRRAGFGMLVAGTVNPVERRAELRDWQHLADLYELRFKRSLPVTPEEWTQFLERAEVIFDLAEIRSTRVSSPPELLAQLESERAKQRTMRIIAVAMVAVAFAFGVAVIMRIVRAETSNASASPSSAPSLSASAAASASASASASAPMRAR